ncbi:MAG TPA: lipid kinase [Peptococcaceae bacterium]|nr:lipid kinase [Peptococcaceae bacterium]
MRICLIFNQQAGAAELIKNFLFHLKPEYRCEIRPTSAEFGAAKIARSAVEEGFDRIVAAGGDGTLSQVVNGLAPYFDAVELGILPLGTGNDFARILGLNPEDPDEACIRALSKHTEPVDLIQISSGDNISYCINVANGGMAGRIANDIKPEDKKRWGPMAYWITSISKLIDLQPFQVKLELDGQEQDNETLCIAIANGRFVGGGFPIAPYALINDGFIDVTVIPVLPIFELMAAGFNFALAREQREDRIRHYKAKKVRIQSEPFMPFSIDGEPAQRIDSTFEVIPQALRIVVGSSEMGLVPAVKGEPFVS